MYGQPSVVSRTGRGRERAARPTIDQIAALAPPSIVTSEPHIDIVRMHSHRNSRAVQGGWEAIDNADPTFQSRRSSAPGDLDPYIYLYIYMATGLSMPARPRATLY